jgi:hypothetical protein
MSRAQKLQESLEPLLEQAGWEFRKLTKDDQPYYFVEWAFDNNQWRCLYYGFAARDQGKRDNEKRVPLNELAKGIGICAHRGKFERSDFNEYCTVAKSAGPCGYTVIGRCLELLGVAEYDSDDHCFTLVSPQCASDWMKEE